MIDFDGTTIVNNRHALPSKKVIEAIAEAKKLLHVGAVTGRIYPDAKRVADMIMLNGPSIILGGAQIVDFASNKILWQQTMSRKDTDDICQLLQRYNQPFFISYKDTKEEHTQASLLPHTEAFTIALTDLSPEQTELFHERLKQFHSLAVHRIIGWKPGTFWLQITHGEATKQHAILEVAKRLKIDTHEIIGVGDGPNDFPLLMACGLKIAMGNAADELKAIADYIAPPVTEDGLAEVINKFVLQRN